MPEKSKGIRKVPKKAEGFGRKFPYEKRLQRQLDAIEDRVRKVVKNPALQEKIFETVSRYAQRYKERKITIKTFKGLAKNEVSMTLVDHLVPDKEKNTIAKELMAKRQRASTIIGDMISGGNVKTATVKKLIQDAIEFKKAMKENTDKLEQYLSDLEKIKSDSVPKTFQLPLAINQSLETYNLSIARVLGFRVSRILLRAESEMNLLVQNTLFLRGRAANEY